MTSGGRVAAPHKVEPAMTVVNENVADEAAAFLSDGYLDDNSADVQRLSVALYRLLAAGQPVALPALANALEWEASRAEAVLRALPPSALERDNHDNITAFIGLSLKPTDHRIEVEGKTLHTWCVLDALFLPEILQKTVQVTTQCPATGAAIHVTLAPDRIVASEPEYAVMSIVAPDGKTCRDNLRGAFCNHVNFFADRAAFDEWANDRPGAAGVSLADAHAMGRRRNAARYPDIEM